jgi:hypothetical protein
LNNSTRNQIKAHIHGFIDTLIERYRSIDSTALSKKSYRSPGKFAPFHFALIPPSLIRLKEIFRGLDTSLGSVFAECARLIALEKSTGTQRESKVEGMINPGVQRRIEATINELGQGLKEPDYEVEVQDVLDAVKTATGGRVKRLVIADLFIPQLKGFDTYFDIKSPKPNKDMLERTKTKLLTVHALLAPTRVRTFFALPYNPFVSKDKYNWSFTKKYMDLNSEVLVGDEFWDFLGGPGTYQELLGVSEEVKLEKDETCTSQNKT